METNSSLFFQLGRILVYCLASSIHAWLCRARERREERDIETGENSASLEETQCCM